MLSEIAEEAIGNGNPARAGDSVQGQRLTISHHLVGQVGIQSHSSRYRQGHVRESSHKEAGNETACRRCCDQVFSDFILQSKALSALGQWF